MKGANALTGMSCSSEVLAPPVDWKARNRVNTFPPPDPPAFLSPPKAEDVLDPYPNVELSSPPRRMHYLHTDREISMPKEPPLQRRHHHSMRSVDRKAQFAVFHVPRPQRLHPTALAGIANHCFDSRSCSADTQLPVVEAAPGLLSLRPYAQKQSTRSHRTPRGTIPILPIPTSQRFCVTVLSRPIARPLSKMSSSRLKREFDLQYWRSFHSFYGQNNICGVGDDNEG